MSHSCFHEPRLDSLRSSLSLSDSLFYSFFLSDSFRIFPISLSLCKTSWIEKGWEGMKRRRVIWDEDAWFEDKYNVRLDDEWTFSLSLKSRFFHSLSLSLSLRLVVKGMIMTQEVFSTMKIGLLVRLTSFLSLVKSHLFLLLFLSSYLSTSQNSCNERKSSSLHDGTKREVFS